MVYVEWSIRKECMCKLLNYLHYYEEEEKNRSWTWRINKCQKSIGGGLEVNQHVDYNECELGFGVVILFLPTKTPKDGEVMLLLNISWIGSLKE